MANNTLCIIETNDADADADDENDDENDENAVVVRPRVGGGWLTRRRCHDAHLGMGDDDGVVWRLTST